MPVTVRSSYVYSPRRHLVRFSSISYKKVSFVEMSHLSGLDVSGIWGGKGQGKSFQLELICKTLGVEPVIMSAGELESEWAGTSFAALF